MMKKDLFANRLWDERNPHVCPYHQELFHVQILSYQTKVSLYCRKIDQDDLDTKGIQDHPRKEGISYQYEKPTNLQKADIGKDNNPKMASVYDYKGDKIASKIVSLLKEYDELFP